MIQLSYKLSKHIFVLLVISALLMLAACSSGSDGGPDDSGDPQGATTKTVADVASDLETNFESYQGDELTDFISQSGVTISTLGFSFCDPDDPMGDPVATSVPPITIYGCTNDVNVSVTPDLGTNSVTVNLEAAHVYIDMSGNINGTDFEGYIAITNLAVEVVVGVSANGDGTYNLVSVDSVSISYDSLTADSNNATINAAINSSLPTVASSITIVAEDFMTAEMDAFIETLPAVTL